MLESIFDDSLVNEDIEMLDISDSDTPDVQVTNIIEEPKIEPIEQIIEEVKVESEPKTKTKDNIFYIQISLLIAWAILTAIVYFFGYPLFEHFINV